MKISILILSVTIVGVYSNCGCLKCNPNLHVVSSPHLPYKVIYRGTPCLNSKPLSYTLQAPVIAPPPLPTFKNYDYRIEVPYIPPCDSFCTHKYEVQAPVITPPPVPLPITGLVARPDRLVLPAPDCQDYNNGPIEKICSPIWPENLFHATLVQQPDKSCISKGPILQRAPSDIYNQIACSCRYGNGKSRSKRSLPILKSSLNFIMGLLPNFIRFPIEQTLRSLSYHPKYTKKPFLKKYYRPIPKRVHRLSEKPPPFKSKPSATFLQKLQKLNRDDRMREKRSLIFDDNEISLPFLRVTDIEDSEEDLEEEDDEDEERSREESTREQFLTPFNFGHLLPHNPIFYLLNTPIRFLHHFHRLGQQISPVFKSVPDIFINSKRYLRNFGKHFKNDVLNFASDLIGDFDEFDIRPKRYRRSLNSSKILEPYEPEYSLVFNNEEKMRSKRYILKVVDEDEVEEFLREKLGRLVNNEPKEQPKRKNKENQNKKKLVVEKLSSKLIIDNNGRPFVEINGVKRPLFFNKKPKEEEGETSKKQNEEIKSEEIKSEEITEDVKDKINALIAKAREKIDKNDGQLHDVPTHIIKDRINQILTEIQNLINMDFDKYSTIHNDLSKLQNFKEILINDWKKVLIEEKSNDMASKIRLLNDFKEMQTLKDEAVNDIASVLANGTNFMTKKLIKILVRLQKLQCIIYRVIEDFGEKIKMDTKSDIRKEIKYVEYLSGLHFIVGQTKHDLEKDLKNERDKALENEMFILENLRKLLENEHQDPHKLYEEAKLLWEINNIDKLQKDTIAEMNTKISRDQKIRKELKILFDLLQQLENCEEKQKKLLNELSSKQKETKHRVVNHTPRDDTKGSVTNRNRFFPHKTIIEDKKPVKLVSNGYTLTAYKVTDGINQSGAGLNAMVKTETKRQLNKIYQPNNCIVPKLWDGGKSCTTNSL